MNAAASKGVRALCPARPHGTQFSGRSPGQRVSPTLPNAKASRDARLLIRSIIRRFFWLQPLDTSIEGHHIVQVVCARVCLRVSTCTVGNEHGLQVR